MNKLALSLVILMGLPGLVLAEGPQAHIPKELPKYLSADGKTLLQAGLVRVLIADPNPAAVPVSIPSQVNLKTAATTATATFAITYVPDGGEDLWGEPCLAFPEAAKATFRAATLIWGNILQSTVPITIRACWADLGSSDTLGYAGGTPIHRDFPGAPLGNTWYDAALANALAGKDLRTSAEDMHITYNRNFSWYYGTDGQPPAGTYDLVTTALHEITHGLNFSGSMRYEGGRGSWGYGGTPAYPSIYDCFVRDKDGKALIDYTNNSFTLGAALTSGNLWFHGPRAKAAHGGQAVRLYAPSSWKPASSYGHLDYNTFINTPNQLMIYVIADGTAIHDPGLVTKALLQDLGWKLFNLPEVRWTRPHNAAKVSSFERSSLKLEAQVHDAESCIISYSKDGVNFTQSETLTVVNETCSVTLNYGEDLAAEGVNWWYVAVSNANGTVRYPASGNLSFSTVNKKLNKLQPILKLLL